MYKPCASEMHLRVQYNNSIQVIGLLCGYRRLYFHPTNELAFLKCFTVYIFGLNTQVSTFECLILLALKVMSLHYNVVFVVFGFLVTACANSNKHMFWLCVVFCLRQSKECW